MKRYIAGHFGTHRMSTYFCGLCRERFLSKHEKARHLHERHGAAVWPARDDNGYEYRAVVDW